MMLLALRVIVGLVGLCVLGTALCVVLALISGLYWLIFPATPEVPHG
jgi:hypothetical protein